MKLFCTQKDMSSGVLQMKTKEYYDIDVTTFHLTTPKPLTVWITTNHGKFLKRWEYQNTLPTSCETCMHVKKQQLEPDMKQ